MFGRQQQLHLPSDDRERIARARQTAEALFTPKAPIGERSVTDTSPSGQLPRIPRILRVTSPIVPDGGDQLERPVARPPQTSRRIPAAHFGRIRAWVKYGMTVPEVAEIYGVALSEVERALRG